MANMGKSVKSSKIKQDLTYFDKKLVWVKKLMHKHPFKNRDYDIEVKTHILASDYEAVLDPTISRQIRRQVERREIKTNNNRYFVKQARKPGIIGPNQRVERHDSDIKTGRITYMTLVNTSRYRHIMLVQFVLSC